MNPIVKELREKKQLKENLMLEIKELEQRCPHEFTRLKLEETLAFEYTPYCSCIDCGHRVFTASPDDILSLYKEELEFLTELTLTDSQVRNFYHKHPLGYNLEDIHHDL